MNNKIIDYYFFILFSLIPLSIIIGASVSLINILLIDFSFLFLLLYNKDYKFLSNNTVKLILILCIYLVFHSIIEKDFSMSAKRNLGFIRFVILFCAFNYFFYYKNFFNKILIFWTIILSILVLDIYFESIFGKNILGYSAPNNGKRIISFFKDEPIAGGYVSSFYLIVVGYFFSLSNNFSKKNKNFILVVSIFFFLSIFITGERANTIKAFLSLVFFYFLNNHYNFRYKILSILLFFLVIVTTINNSDFLKMRYGKAQIIESNFSGNSVYFNLYNSGIKVFTNYPILGVGNKNYRVEACERRNIDKNYDYLCNTHPHQIYIEFLAEHGLIGTTILLFIFFKLIFSKLRIISMTKNYIQIGCFVYLLTIFTPLIPSGAFFADYNLTLFWLNLSLMYAVNKKTNIYSSN